MIRAGGDNTGLIPEVSKSAGRVGAEHGRPEPGGAPQGPGQEEDRRLLHHRGPCLPGVCGGGRRGAALCADDQLGLLRVSAQVSKGPGTLRYPLSSATPPLQILQISITHRHTVLALRLPAGSVARRKVII